ncbi:AMP-dependent synthetase/ligase [Arthrobacter sp. EpRS71]|uniref:AMP-dependent synthetase/ligase n=1 Tax=Arthrobacter sp. EpRS71 TaxID=1743141 RepID=UPI000748652C|nr:AMP-dependent synthetase/ligase [Arthrobacter sp. EpRS71]KUM40359.1 long-chain fatty acid--CoA ligase [Arthrobacter sp. EpRS71]
MREASTELLVEADPNSNVTDLLLERCHKDPFGNLYAHKTANGWLNVSAARFLADVTALAKGLIAGGLSTGDPVAVLSHSSFEWTLVDFAIWMAGGVTVPIYETSSASQIEWILADSGARRIFVEDSGKADLVHALVENSAVLGEDPVTIIRMEHDGDAPNLTSVSAVGIGVMDNELERQRSAANLASVASIVYTSGTTGKPKGCEITHGNFVLVARNVIPFLPELLMKEGARTLMFLPLAHVLARAVQVVCLTAGITLGHSAGASGLMADLGSFKPTFLLAVPRIFEKVYAGANHKAAMSGKSALFTAASATAVQYSTAVDLAARGEGPGPGWLLGLKHSTFNKLLYPKVRELFGGDVGYTVSGASPLSLRDNHFFHGAGIPVLEGYGLTETTAPCTVNTPSMSRIGTVGIPLPGTTIRVAQDGEVLVKGIGVFKGYHNNDEATRAAFVDGFFRTGDVGELDADGFLTITGRKKDLLVTAGGKNVAPAPLEEKLREHPLVGQAVVVGDGRPFVAALLGLDPEGLTDWCAENKVGVLSPEEAASDDRVKAAVQSAVDEANKLVSAAESIKKFAFITAELSVESGHLTPSLKLKRAAVLSDFSAAVEKLYEK